MTTSEKRQSATLPRLVKNAGIIMMQRVVEQPLDRRIVLHEGEALKCPDANVRMRQSNQNARTSGGGLVATHQRFAGFNQAEGLRRIDEQRLEHFRRQESRARRL